MIGLKHRFRYIFITGILAVPTLASADQPIMNMMPRWDGGYGFQLLTEHIHRRDLKLGDRVIGSGLTEDINKLHLEAVYTWDRSIRMTFKLPYISDARREQIGLGGIKEVQEYEGLGDMTIALPLKRYFNLAARSGSWTLAPQVRIPIGKKQNKYQVPDRVWGTGISIGYETETYRWFLSTGAKFWIFGNKEPSEWGWTLDLGWKPTDGTLLLIETDIKWDNYDAFSISSGPAIYWRWSDRVHTRIEFKHDFISEVSTREPDHSNGDNLRFGIGFVF